MERRARAKTRHNARTLSLFFSLCWNGSSPTAATAPDAERLRPLVDGIVDDDGVATAAAALNSPDARCRGLSRSRIARTRMTMRTWHHARHTTSRASSRRARTSDMGAPSDAIRHASRRIREEIPNACGTALDLRGVVEKFADDSKACDVLSAVRRAWHATTGDPSNKLSERELVRYCSREFVANLLRDSWRTT